MNGLPGSPFGAPPNAGAPIQSTVQTPGGQPAVHICFSGQLTCSGVNPCDECAQVVKANVLVMALMEEQRVLALDLQQALSQGRPLDLQLLATTFFRTVANAYRQLHTAMMQEPPERRPFRIANITAILEAAEAYRALMIAQQQAAQAAQQQPVNAGPINASPINTTPPNAIPSNGVNVAAPVKSAEAPPVPNLSAVIPQVQSPGDMMKMAMEVKGDVITVSPEPPSPPPPADAPRVPSGPAVAKPLSVDDFRDAAPPANGSSHTS